MLGFDAIGRLALGQMPSGTVQQAITGTVGAAAFLKVQSTNTSAMAVRLSAAVKSRDQWTGLASVLGKSASQANMKAPGGMVLRARVNAQAKSKAPGGYLLFAKAAMNSSGLSDIHMEGKTSAPRDPLLLNSASEFTASYWKGRS